MLGLIGKKVGMTQVFDEKGRLTPVTVIKVEGNVVVAERTEEKNGYNAAVLGSGEMKADREAGYTEALVEYQTLIALTGLTNEQVEDVVIAYEPVWAIGTGLTATDEQANETIGVIRKAVARKYGQAVADKMRIQYGGSMNPKNVKGLMAQPEIDGGLIGGASLKAPDFSLVVNYDK